MPFYALDDYTSPGMDHGDGDASLVVAGAIPVGEIVPVLLEVVDQAVVPVEMRDEVVYVAVMVIATIHSVLVSDYLVVVPTGDRLVDHSKTQWFELESSFRAILFKSSSTFLVEHYRKSMSYTTCNLAHLARRVCVCGARRYSYFTFNVVGKKLEY